MDKTLILVVEDDIQVQKLITVTLKAEGYRFLTAQTGQAAVITVATHNPDIILLDPLLVQCPHHRHQCPER